MIHINITDERGTLLGQTTLDIEDFDQNLAEPSVRTQAWIGQKILDELPANPVMRRKLLEGSK